MLSLPPSVRVFLATQPVDGRKGMDSLAALVRNYLREDPLSGHLFVVPWSALLAGFVEPHGEGMEEGRCAFMPPTREQRRFRNERILAGSPTPPEGGNTRAQDLLTWEELPESLRERHRDRVRRIPRLLAGVKRHAKRI
jgi:hypothetical protein